jgi:hypothetical protein
LLCCSDEGAIEGDDGAVVELCCDGIKREDGGVWEASTERYDVVSAAELTD